MVYILSLKKAMHIWNKLLQLLKPISEWDDNS